VDKNKDCRTYPALTGTSEQLAEAATEKDGQDAHAHKRDRRLTSVATIKMVAYRAETTWD
jgi:predicted transcriptional regulator of viral defense system